MAWNYIFALLLESNALDSRTGSPDPGDWAWLTSGVLLLLVYNHSSTAYSDLDTNKIRVLASTRLHCSKVTSITAIYKDKNRNVPAHSRGTGRTPSVFDSPTQGLSNQPWKGILLKSMITMHHLFRAIGVVPAMTRLDTYSHGLP